MANWTNIPTDRIEPGKPIRAIDGLALRDNPIAIAEGASGAPKIREAAISTNSINGNRLRSGTVTNTQIANMDAGKLNSGTIPGARMPMGAGGVGTYAFVVGANSSTIRSWNWGNTAPGSQLSRASIDADGSIAFSGTLSGTWRIVSAGVANDRAGANTSKRAGLALRIS